MRVAFFIALHAATGLVHELTRNNWHELTQDTTWLINFYQQGCVHCKRMKPLWEAVASSLEQTTSFHVGKVDCTAHNGIARTFGIDKFPSVLLLEPSGNVYEYKGRRGLHDFISFARGGFRAQEPMMRIPPELLADVSDWYLLLLALWRPLAFSFGLAVAIALCLKGCAQFALRLLQQDQGEEGRKTKTT